MRRWQFFILSSFSLACLGQDTRSQDFPPVFNSPSEDHLTPMAAEEAAAKMRLPSGFRATVFASEPDVQNPIAMAWDDRSRLWIAENYTYSDQTLHFDLSLRDRVLVFEDRDGDGRSDSRTVFTDQVQMLTSVEVGRGGVWLMCPPQLLFIPDANGDAQPDGPAQVKLDGFKVAQESYHNFANGLRWGPDGWLYGRCGHSCPGRLGPPGTSDEDRIPIDGGIWRFHPDRNVVEVLCHGTVNPWGHDWDRNGELFFINTVIGHLWHLMPGAHFKESFGESSNPSVYERMDTIADHYHYDTSGSWSDSRDGKANELGGGHAHIGAMIYQGSAWPQEYQDKLFTLNMHGQRMNVERLEQFGAGFIGKHEPDFFVASDPFFRAIDVSMSPDGNAFVIDWSDTGECHERNGIHRKSGRIFKISYEAAKSSTVLTKPACLQGDGKLPQLWKRYQQGAVNSGELMELLQDPDEHVRAWAIRLLTDAWPLDTILGPGRNASYPDEPLARAALVERARIDHAGLVHLVLASTLQRLPIEHRVELATELCRHEGYAKDRDLPWLVWYGLIPACDADPKSVVPLATSCRWPKLIRWIARSLASKVESDPLPLNRLLESASAMPVEAQVEVLIGMKEAYRGWRTAPRPHAWTQWVESFELSSQAQVIRELNSLFGDGRAIDEIRQLVLDGRAEIKLRQKALETLIDARPDDLRTICEALIDVRTLNATALRGLSMFDDPSIGEKLAKKYRRFTPEDRPAVLAALVSRPTFAHALLDVMAEKNTSISGSELTAYHARQIRTLGDDELNRKLAATWGALRDSPQDRQAMIQTMKSQLTPDVLAKANVVKGRMHFSKLCMQCHLLYGTGQKVGPDLTGTQRSNLDYLLENILDPSAMVGKDFRLSIVRTSDDRIVSGLIVARDRKSTVIQTATAREAIATEEIEEERETTQSAMPDGLLNNLSQTEITDLFAYLMHPVQVPLPVP